MTSSGLDSSKIPARPELNYCFVFVCCIWGGGFSIQWLALNVANFSAPLEIDYRWDSLCQVKGILENLGKESNTTNIAT